LFSSRFERQAALNVHFDHRNAQIDIGLGTKLLHSPRVQICGAGFDVIDRNDVSDIVLQNDIGSHGAF
jgi:hypothetical protein